ncbi:hypothetical protein DFAR_2720001 [Desulfarculales bacterium]
MNRGYQDYALFGSLIHNAYKINPKRKFMRKNLTSLSGDKTPAA